MSPIHKHNYDLIKMNHQTIEFDSDHTITGECLYCQLPKQVISKNV